MTVTYKHASGDTVICHGLDHAGEATYYTGPLGDSENTDTEWSVEPIKPIGAANATPADRGCGVHMFMLWVERRFATEGEARAHARNLPGLLPRGGVSLEVTGEETGYKSVCSSAALQKLSTRRNGCSLDIIFQFMTSVPVRTAV
jgi:hypothetical protein